MGQFSQPEKPMTPFDCGVEILKVVLLPWMEEKGLSDSFLLKTTVFLHMPFKDSPKSLAGV